MSMGPTAGTLLPRRVRCGARVLLAEHKNLTMHVILAYSAPCNGMRGPCSEAACINGAVGASSQMVAQTCGSSRTPKSCRLRCASHVARPGCCSPWLLKSCIQRAPLKVSRTRSVQLARLGGWNFVWAHGELPQVYHGCMCYCAPMQRGCAGGATSWIQCCLSHLFPQRR